MAPKNLDRNLLKIPGCKFWYADFYANGKRVRVSTREVSKIDARRKLVELMANHNSGAPQTDRWLTYGDLRDMLIRSYKEEGNKSLHVRANGEETVNGLSQLDKFFKYKPPANTGPYVKDINTDTGRAFRDGREAEGAGAAVINRSLACLTRMLNIAHEEKKLAYVPKMKFAPEPPARQGTVSEEKFNELLKMLPTNLRPLILFLYWSGVRVGEALKIQWEQVYLVDGVIVLKEGETKNDEPRTIPLASPVLAMLREIEPKTGPVFSSTNLRKAWQKACAAVGLGTLTPVEGKPYDPKYSGLNIHDLRRTALTELTRSGVHQFVAMRISGHKTTSVFERYNIVNTQDLLAAVRLRERLNLPNGKTRPAMNSAKVSAKKLVSSTKH